MAFPPRHKTELEMHRGLLRRGQLVNHYQPIVGLCSGKVLGVEVLTRLRNGDALIPPNRFLRGFTTLDFDEVLFQSLRAGCRMLHECSASHRGLALSFNVSPTMLTRNGFAAQLLLRLREGGLDPRRITLEILEDHEFLDLGVATAEIDLLRAAGVTIALDDVGSGYASLARIKALPVDTIKLDQVFVRDLLQRPDELQFVASMISLSRGLRKTLVVEGVETEEILDALRVLGVDAAQGYAIARPMPAEALSLWLSGHVVEVAKRMPTSLLGLYAAQLMLIESGHLMTDQKMTPPWASVVDGPYNGMVGRYLDAQGLYDTEYGRAHLRFHETIAAPQHDPAAWHAAAETLRDCLGRAVIAGSRTRALRQARPSAREPDQVPDPRRRVVAGLPDNTA